MSLGLIYRHTAEHNNRLTANSVTNVYVLTKVILKGIELNVIVHVVILELVLLFPLILPF